VTYEAASWMSYWVGCTLYFCCVQGDVGLDGLPGPKGDPGSAVTTQPHICFVYNC